MLCIKHLIYILMLFSLFFLIALTEVCCGVKKNPFGINLKYRQM